MNVQRTLQFVSFFILILPFFAPSTSTAADSAASICRNAFPAARAERPTILKPINILSLYKGEGDQPMPMAHYIRSATERAQYEWFIVDGKFVKKVGKGWMPITTSAGRAIFVATTKGRIFGLDHKDLELLENRTGLGVFHSTLLAGRPVGFAGTVKIVNGKLEQLSTQSGHYHPSNEALVEFLAYLTSLGADLAGTSITPRFYERSAWPES